MPADERRTVTAPVSGKRVRIPTATGVLNGLAVDLMNLSRANVLAIDAQITGIRNGYLQLVIVNDRIARFDHHKSTSADEIEREFIGQAPPTPKRSAA